MGDVHRPGMLHAHILRSPVAHAETSELDDETIRGELSGNICRCTGYQPIVAALRSVALGRGPSGATH